MHDIGLKENLLSLKTLMRIIYHFALDSDLLKTAQITESVLCTRQK